VSPRGASPEGAKENGSRYHVQLPKLPPQWTYERFDKVLDIQGGSQPPKSTFVYEPTPGYVQLLQIRDFGERGVPTFVREDSVTKRCTKDDILIARYGASLGRIVTGESGAYNVALAKVIFDKNQFFNRYLFYLLQTPFFQTPIHMISRSAQNGFNKGDLSDIILPVAPLSEQRRIVAEIEKQFTRLEAGVAALQRVQANLKRYRAAVLKAACEGKLVPTEAELAAKSAKKNSDPGSASSVAKHPGYETGTELLARILAECRKNWEQTPAGGSRPTTRRADAVGRVPSRGVRGRGKYKEPAAPDTANLPSLPEGWTWASGAQLFAWSSGDGLAQKDIQPGDYPVYGGNGVTSYHNEFIAEFPTIVIGRVGALCGNVYLTKGRAWITDNAIYATRTPSFVSMKFVEIAFIRAGLNKRAAGSGQPFVNQRILNETVVPLPPVAEQTRIVGEVERRLSVVEELESVVSANLQRASRLRQSILQKAFSGELV